MTESGYARGVLGSLVYGLWGLPMTWIGDSEMIQALTNTPERVGQFRIMFPQPDMIRMMSWGITLGVGIGQMRRRWRAPGETAITLDEAEDGSWKVRLPERPVGEHETRVLRAWDPKYLRCEWWNGPTWHLMTADGEIQIEPNDGEWVLYTPYGVIKPWEQGAWKALSLAFVLGRDALFDRSRHAEVLAPVRVGTVPQGTTERQRKAYLAQIRAMQRMHMFVLPPGLDYKIVESTGRINEIYEQIIKWAEREVALIFTGNETTTTGSKGFTSGDVQERIARHLLASFASSLSDTLHDGGLVHWAADNYGTTEAPLAQFDCDPPEDKKIKADTVKSAADALSSMVDALAKVGKRITDSSIERYAQVYGLAIEDAPAASLPAVPSGDAPAHGGNDAPALPPHEDTEPANDIEAVAAE